MIGRALNENNDIFLENGSFKLVSEGAQVAQHLRTRLQFYLEEWFLDRSAGMPWFQTVMVKPADLKAIESAIKNKIVQTPNIDRIVEFEMDYEGGNARSLTVTASVETTFGVININEVTING